MKSSNFLEQTLYRLHILNALRNKSGDLSYLEDVFARVNDISSASSEDMPEDEYYFGTQAKAMTRKDVWTITESLVVMGLVDKKAAETDERKVYSITDKGKDYLTAFERNFRYGALLSA